MDVRKGLNLIVIHSFISLIAQLPSLVSYDDGEAEKTSTKLKLTFKVKVLSTKSDLIIN